MDKALAAAPISGDLALVESLVANLIDNALRHNVHSGQVDVATEALPALSLIRVTNTGPEVPPQDVVRIFEPFRRAESDRTRNHDGHGLGLSIVRAVAEAHDAVVAVEPRSQGGLQIEVRFPHVPS